MKKFIFTAVLSATMLVAAAQINTDPFSRISAEGNIRVVLSDGESNSISFGDAATAPEGFAWEVTDGQLILEANKVKETVVVNVTAPDVSEIKLSSVAELKTANTYSTPSLKLISEGAAAYNMALDCDQLSLDFKGASEAVLSGKTRLLSAKLSGASDIKAYDLACQDADIVTDGASELRLMVAGSLKAKGSGASEIRYKGEPTTVEVELDGVASVSKSDGSSSDGNVTVHVCDDGDHNCKDDKKSYDGHWAGLDLMFNNFISKYGELGIAPGYDFMEPDFAKSIGVQINFMEFNVGLVERPKFSFGMTTGLGLSVWNYRLADQVRLINDSAVLMAYADPLVSTIRSKLTVSYLNIPLLLEFNTDGTESSSGFHFGVGGYGGVRVGSHTKVVINDRGDKDKFKSDGSYHLNPFRYGVMLRMGWNKIHLSANYALSEMFEEGEGPAVYPVEFGISFDLN